MSALILMPWLQIFDPLRAIRKTGDTVVSLIKGDYLGALSNYMESVPGMTILGYSAKPIGMIVTSAVLGPASTPQAAFAAAKAGGALFEKYIGSAAKVWTYPARYVWRIGGKIVIRAIGGLTQAAKGWAIGAGAAAAKWATTVAYPVLLKGAAAVKAGLIAIGPKGWLVLAALAAGAIFLTGYVAGQSKDDKPSSSEGTSYGEPENAVSTTLFTAPKNWSMARGRVLKS